MTVDRRDFFLRSAAGLGALALPACAHGGVAAQPTVPASLATWADVRAQFPLTRDRIHMTQFLLASHPKPVSDDIERHRRGLDENPADYLHDNEGPLELATRRAAEAYMGAKIEEVALTDSTTMGIGVVYGGLDLRPGQEILTTTHDHLVTHLALDYAAARAKTTVKKIALYDDPSRPSVDEMATRLGRAITPATRLVALTWVHSGTGVKLPIRALSEVVAKANAGRADADRALLFVDGVHGFGNQDVRAADLGCDFFMAGCHKWIFGPRGTGVVYGKRELWSLVKPFIPAFDIAWRTERFDQIPPVAFISPGGFHSFEHRWALPAAFAFHERIGFARVAARIRELNTRCKDQLAKVKGVKVITPMAPELSAGIICFEVAGKKPEQVQAGLAAQKIVASVTPPFYTPTYARLAPSLLTDEADVDRAVAAVATL